MRRHRRRVEELGISESRQMASMRSPKVILWQISLPIASVHIVGLPRLRLMAPLPSILAQAFSKNKTDVVA